MTTFKDTENREWTIRLDFASLQAIKDAAQVDLGNVEQLAKTWAELLLDDGKALHVLWLAISRAAAASGVERPEFLASMNGDTLHAALEALGAAIESFTQPRKRGVAERSIRGVSEGMRRAMEQAETEIEKVMTERTEAALEALGMLEPTSQE